MTFKNKLQKQTIITDGAMGTYYTHLVPNTDRVCETANIEDPQTIAKIHQQYIDAGAELIRTNTFAANSYSLNVSQEKVKEIVHRACSIAKEIATDNVDIGASIGPIPDFLDHRNTLTRDDIQRQYKAIIDVFLEEKINIFVFETFGSLSYLTDLSTYIKQKDSTAFVLTQFALTADGKTRKGISAEKIVEEAENVSTIDAYGFNCGVGPAHLLHIIKQLPKGRKIRSILPNAGYPAIINERTVYTNNPKYFARMMQEAKDLGVNIIGGCCGTTPEHIKYLAKGIKEKNAEKLNDVYAIPKQKSTKRTNETKKTVLVELAPPSNTKIKKTIDGAKRLAKAGATMITVPDSPMAKMRANSMLMAAKIQREAGIIAMPHLSCRDQNIIALKGSILSGYIEEIRNILVVTGDPVPEANRGSVKSVFNLNSYRLTQLINEMNIDLFAQQPINIACALNFNVAKPEIEINRMKKKVDYGARLFLTQPIFHRRAIETLAKTKKNKDVRIYAGLMPLVTYRNAQFINNELPGIHIPEEYVNKFHPDMSRQEAQAVGVSIITDIAAEIRPYVDGFYLITPFNRYAMMEQIVRHLV